MNDANRPARRDETVLAIDRHFDDTYPPIIRDIATELFVRLMECADIAAKGEAWVADFAFQQGENIRENFGGQAPYIGKGTVYACSLRDREIYARFRGDNIARLARDAGLSEMRIRQIITRCRLEDQRRRQATLPFDEK